MFNGLERVFRKYPRDVRDASWVGVVYYILLENVARVCHMALSGGPGGGGAGRCGRRRSEDVYSYANRGLVDQKFA